MQLAKLTMLRKSTLFKISTHLLLLYFIQTLTATEGLAQENSPYSRYGLGDMAPNTNIVNRGMGGLTAAYSDFLTINFNNPATYSNFQTKPQALSKKIDYGRVILDAGINYDSRTLRSPNQPDKFNAANLFFSYLQLGIPLRTNWGLSLGLRPLSRIDYKIVRRERLIDPVSGNSIDSALTEFTGNGGSFLPSIGTGFAIKNFSVGVNVSYLFGRKENSTKRAILNDSVLYNNSNHTTRSSFGGMFFNTGAQYKININSNTVLRLGISGNIERSINATQDILRETFIRDPDAGDFRLDSVYEQNDVKGKIVYPASFTTGFVVDHQEDKGTSWLFGADFIRNKWSNYRFFGNTDLVQDNWQLRVGAQFRAKPSRNYFSNVAYRAGFFVGPDYIKVGEELPQLGISFGMGLPVANYNRQALGQFTVFNVAFEYLKRGNYDNLLKENLFRISLGLNFSDLWFRKRKYD